MNKHEELNRYWETEIRPQLDPLHSAEGDLLYYVFQTPYRFQPELLIVGINPGGDYKDVPFLKREKNWYTEKTREPRSFNDIICSVFGYGKNDKLFNLLENAVGTNRIFFNSGSVEKLKRKGTANEMIRKCVKIADNLVDNFIQPKRIVCLGVPPFDGTKNKEKQIEQPIAGLALKKSYRGEIPVYFIPNPSRLNINRYYSPEQIAQYQHYFEQEFLE